MLPQTFFPSGTTKTAINGIAKQAVDELMESGNVLAAAELIAGLEAFVKEVRADERFTDLITAELAKYSGKLTTASGAKLELAETGVKYDYSANADWERLVLEENNAATQRKWLEQKLRNIPAGQMLVDQETGETLVGPAKSSKSSYKITLAK